MSNPPQANRNAAIGAVLLATAGLILLRMVGPARLLALIFLAGGAFYLNRTDPKRLAAVLVVVGGGLAYLAWKYVERT